MARSFRRRFVCTAILALGATGPVQAQRAEIWSAARAHAALRDGRIVMLDIRSREEWFDTRVARGAWTVSLHEDRFPERLFTARQLAAGRPVALICATGGRSASVMRSLRRAGYDGFVDVSEGMLGSRRGPGWIAAGFPLVGAASALDDLPAALA